MEGRIERRHDLDALRGVAMLLGIVLHGAISFIPGTGAFWAVQDVHTSDMFGVLMAAIHGFRMPLFFLISGFFTAMLWRKRGLWSLLKHRFTRIFLPMVIGLFTIIPATWAVSAYVKADGGKGKPDETSKAVNEGVSLDLMGAAATGDVVSAERLIEQGADLEEKNQDGSTPLLAAVFFGRDAVTELLLDAGADPYAKNNKGERPVDMLHAPWGITKFIADLVSIKVDEAEVTRGRKRIAELFEEREIEIGEAEGGNALAGLIQLLLYFPLLGHLWFLWFLCWLVAGFSICVSIGSLVGIRRLPTWLTIPGWRYIWLIPLTAIPQALMNQGSFGPDTSIGLLPLPTVLFYYAIFFGFGACYFDADDRDGKVGRCWYLTIPLAVLVIFIGLPIADAQRGDSNRLASVFCQTAYVWLVSFGMMGLFRSFMFGESRVMRYLSDSSYWLYLAHIPLIIYVQYCVRDWQVSAFIKFPLVCVVTSGLLLLTYQLFVRYTPIGTLLNGKRRRDPKVDYVEAVAIEPN